MDNTTFQAWLSAGELLTQSQREEALALLLGEAQGSASVAAVERCLDEDRHCPHCNTPGANKRGMARGLRRYQCKGCGKTFNAVTGTPLSGLHYKDRWLSFAESLAHGETVKEAASRCKFDPTTAFRWRHRFLKAVQIGPVRLKGIVEVDETYVLESAKGQRGLKRQPRKRGGKASKRGLSDEQVPVLVAADRSGITFSTVLSAVTSETLSVALEPVLAPDVLLVSDGGSSYPPCAATLKVSHEALNLSAGERVRGDLHIQTVNNRHSRLKDFLRLRRGIASKYLDSYLRWFHMIILDPVPTQRTCLAAAMTRPCIQFAN